MTKYAISSADPLSKLIKSEGIKSWDKLMSYVQGLPYGRNRNRGDVKLVMIERKGTCSSKHAFLKTVADLNNIPNVELMLGMYYMNQNNTPGIGTALEATKLDFIPEAHCYLKIDGKRLDLTSTNSNFSTIEKDIIQELSIQPEQVREFKVSYHKDFLRNWLTQNETDMSFEDLWAIREKCIESLYTKKHRS